MVSDIDSAPNNLSVEAGVYLSVCISSELCLQIFSLINQSSAVWTSQPRGRNTNWRSEATQTPTSMLTHIHRSRTTTWLGCTRLPLRRDVSSPLLENLLLQSGIKFDIYTLLKDAAVLQPELCSGECSVEV